MPNEHDVKLENEPKNASVNHLTALKSSLASSVHDHEPNELGIWHHKLKHALL